ncbi:MAG: hypothetical protein P4M11_03385 [Candidatus Pacebacteria bacterium]|nr:hypothetical protein [Candidatus Paceibacterota bacterium]
MWNKAAKCDVCRQLKKLKENEFDKQMFIANAEFGKIICYKCALEYFIQIKERRRMRGKGGCFSRFDLTIPRNSKQAVSGKRMVAFDLNFMMGIRNILNGISLVVKPGASVYVKKSEDDELIDELIRIAKSERKKETKQRRESDTPQ